MGASTRSRKAIFAAVAVAVNVAAIAGVLSLESVTVDDVLAAESRTVEERFDSVIDGYEHSFLLFSRMLSREIERNPDPDSVERFLKQIDAPLLDIEGDEFDGLYAYYAGRYLYSWDTAASVYEESGYMVTERPWYQAAVAAEGAVAFTPPYMSYANDYILCTVSQLQPDGETVHAYDVKMGGIQAITSLSWRFPDGKVMVYDESGTVIGSTDEAYLGGSVSASAEDAESTAAEARDRARSGSFESEEERSKAVEEADAAEAFSVFWTDFEPSFALLDARGGSAAMITVGGVPYYGSVSRNGDYGFLALVPATRIWLATVGTWLVPLLVVELLLVYALMRVNKMQKERELRTAYIELGQMQSRLEIAIEAAKKDAAIDDLTGMMNARSFKKEVSLLLERMEFDGEGVFIMLDGDRFKTINDTYGHDVGDEAIKLSAQMIVGRIRIDDVACRLHGDEFAIFLTGTSDYEVAERLVDDINATIAYEGTRRGTPVISLSAGAVAAGSGDAYFDLSKRADEALYHAKAAHGHDGGFARWSAS